MNIGYSNKTMIENGLNDIQCPVCKSNVYVNKWASDFVCTNSECKLYYGSLGLIRELNSILGQMREH